MDDAKRYDCTNGGAQFCQGCYTMTENAHGDWVLFEDYEKMKIRVKAFKDAAIYMSAVCDLTDDNFQLAYEKMLDALKT